MTREDIIKYATTAGFHFHDAGHAPILHTVESAYSEKCFERFASLVAAAEREACAKVCEDIDTEYHGEDVLATWCAAAIRARGGK